MHHHVLACSYAGTVFREHTFSDPEESISFFIRISKEFFDDNIIGSITDIEYFMNQQINKKEQDGVTIGQPAFVLAWVPCAGCTGRKIYN